MKYDFTTFLDRKGTGALAFDSLGKIPGFAPEKPKKGFSIIPMWVADMNFKCYPNIQKSMVKRIKHPLFGYFDIDDEYYSRIIKWQKNRNNVKGLKKENIGYENGVLGGVVSAVNVLCSAGDNILINSPTYIGFTNSLNNNGYHLIHSDLKKDKDGIFRLDLNDMQKKVDKYKIHTFVFCSPHNPMGRVWEESELKELSKFCEKNELYIISDEIWSDIILDSNKHIPTQSISKYMKYHTFSLYAPSKTFNLAGLVGSYHICYNEKLHERILKESSLCHYNEPNLLSIEALIGAYDKNGEVWVNELKETLSKNVTYAYNYIKDNFKGITSTRPEGTYMLYLDLSEYCEIYDENLDDILKKAWDVGVGLQDGRMFNGKCHIRMNVALPYDILVEAMERLKKYVFK